MPPEVARKCVEEFIEGKRENSHKTLKTLIFLCGKIRQILLTFFTQEQYR